MATFQRFSFSSSPSQPSSPLAVISPETFSDCAPNPITMTTTKALSGPSYLPVPLQAPDSASSLRPRLSP
ncbi:hypothetical protein CR513_60683, partial [Mucuna pruriens]